MYELGESIKVSKFEAELNEFEHGIPSEEKTILTFKILDDIIPHLGVFIKTVKTIREVLFDAIYSSSKYTGASETIRRIPYFLLNQRLNSERDEAQINLQERLLQLENQLRSQMNESSSYLHTIETLNARISQQDEQCLAYKKQIEEANKKNNLITQQLNDARHLHSRVERELTDDLTSQQDRLVFTQQECNHLQQYKDNYNSLFKAFAQESSKKELANPPRLKKQSNKQNMKDIKSEIQHTQLLENQIRIVQNTLMQEFDDFMQRFKKNLQDKTADHEVDKILFEEEENDIKLASQELEAEQQRFISDIKATENELLLLSEHCSILKRRLQDAQEHRSSAQSKNLHSKKLIKDVNSTFTEKNSEIDDFTNLCKDLEIDKSIRKDPFVAHDHLSSKYSAMIYTSQNGRTFQNLIKHAFCDSCGSKTIICPHKFTSETQVFNLPPGCTHLMIARPAVPVEHKLLNPNFTSGIIEKVCDEIDRTKSVPSFSTKAKTSEELFEDRESTPLDLADESPSCVKKLHENMLQRSIHVRRTKRDLNLDQVLSIVEEFSAFLILSDESCTSGENQESKILSILDSLYVFMKERYTQENISHFAIQDLIKALGSFRNSKMIQLFSKVLAGSLDGAVLRYILIINDFIDSTECTDSKDPVKLFQTIYPNLNEDELEMIVIGFTSFGENKISKQLLSDYIIHQILNDREPRFLENEKKLLNHPGKELSHMTRTEYIESSDNILSVVIDELRQKLFLEAENCKDSALESSRNPDISIGVSVNKLAQITTYLQIQQISIVIKEEIQKIFHNKDAGTSKHSVSGLITLNSVRDLAANIHRMKLYGMLLNGD